MAISPPILAPLTAPLVSDSGLAELWRTLLPWEDLSAKSIPTRHLNLGRDILPAMAIMVASGGAKPELLEADDDGALITSFSGGSSTFTTASAIVGSTVLTVRSVEIFKKGGDVLVIGGDNSPVTGQTIFRGACKGIGDSTITIDPLNVAVSVNDTVVAIPQLSVGLIDRPVIVQPPTGITRTKTGFQAIAGGGTFIIIPALPTTTLTVFGWAGVIDTSVVGAEIQFEDTSGLNLLMYVSGGAANAYQPWELPRPAVLPTGRGIRARNPGAANANIAGTLFTLP